MQQMREPPDGVGAIRSRRRPPRRRTSVTLPDAWSLEDLEALLASHQEAVAAQIEQGVRALHTTAVRLMGELASADDGVSPEDEARGLLAHVDERYQALNLRMERLEGALRQLVQTFKSSMASIPPELSERMDGMAEAIHGVATRQDLEAFTRRTGEGLARIAARSGEELARAAGRQEDILDGKLQEMRQAIEGIRMSSPAALPEELGPSGPERAASAFVERLRAAEDRLGVAAERIQRWDPFEEERPADAGRTGSDLA